MKENNKLAKSEILGYALGDFGGVITFGTIGSFLQMYYTDVLGLGLGSIVTLMLVARIWDAINDPICGALIDSRTPTKHGRFRPYVWWFSIPLAVAFILTFTKIPGLGQGQYLIYAYITYILYGMLYTAVNIPYGSMASVMTGDLKERSTLSIIRSVGAGFGTLSSQIILPLFVYSTTAAGVKYLDGAKLSRGVMILAVCSVIIFYGFFRLTREHIAPVKQKKENFIRTFVRLLHDRAFVALCIASMFMIFGSMYTQTIFNYLFKNYFEKPGLFALVTVSTYLPMVILMPFTGRLASRYGKKEICAFGTFFAAAAFLILFFVKTTNPYVFLAVITLSGFGLCFATLEVWAMVTDVIEYHQYKTGRRSEGTTYACFSFFRKLGQTLAGAGSTLMLAAIGYVSSSTVIEQSASVNSGIYTIATIVPFVIYLIMFLMLQFGYNLTKKTVEEVHASVNG